MKKIKSYATGTGPKDSGDLNFGARKSVKDVGGTVGGVQFPTNIVLEKKIASKVN